MQLDKAIKTRKSVRKFKDKKPSWKDILEALDASIYAPMAGDIFTLRLMLIDDKELIQEIATYSAQDFIAQAKYVAVFVSRNQRTVTSYGKRGEVYVRQQAGAAIQNFLLKITELKLSTCWIGHFQEKRIKDLLKIPEDRQIEAVFPIGYEIKKPLEKKTKRDLNDLIYFNEWKNKKMQKKKIAEGRWPEGY